MKKSLLLLLATLCSISALHAAPASADSVSPVSGATDSLEITVPQGSTFNVSLDGYTPVPDSDFTNIEVDYDLTATLIHNAVIAIGCTLIFIGGCIAFVWLLLYYRRRRHLDKLEIVSKSLDLNRPLPKEFFHTGYRPTQRNLTGGIFWVGAGISLMTLFLVLNIPFWPLGLLLITIGVSKIAGYIVATRNEIPETKE